MGGLWRVGCGHLSQGKLVQAAGAATSGNHSVASLGQVGPSSLSSLLSSLLFSSLPSPPSSQMYSDSGLLGAMVVAEAAAAGKVVAAVAQALRTVQVGRSS